MLLVFILVLAGIFIYVPEAQSKSAQAIPEADAINGTDADAPSAAEPDSTASPAATEEPDSTPEPSVIPHETASPKPSASPTKSPAKLKKVSGVELVRYSTHSVKVRWNKHKKAKYYRVYFYKKTGKPKLAGITKSTQYIAGKLKDNTTYYFYVVACKKKKCLTGTAVLQRKCI